VLQAVSPQVYESFAFAQVFTQVEGVLLYPQEQFHKLINSTSVMAVMIIDIVDRNLLVSMLSVLFDTKIREQGVSNIVWLGDGCEVLQPYIAGKRSDDIQY